MAEAAGRRTARPRPEAVDGDATGAGAAATAHGTPGGSESPFSASGHVCPVAFCPVGMALTFAEAARPEVVQHLMAAGQELLLAVKAMIDARVAAVDGSDAFEHIRIR
jgi:hypothetical protein